MLHIQGLVFSYKHISRISVATTIAIAIAISALLLFICSQSPGLPLPQFGNIFFSSPPSPSPPPPPADPCSGRYVYVYDLPHHFNSDLLRECSTLKMWIDMCKFIVNPGLGPHLNDSSRVLSQAGRGWYTTNQFTLEIIFHNRMKQYPCRTTNSSIAEAVYVPFYAGLEFRRHMRGYNISVIDALSLDLAQWLRSRPEWQLYGGSDHFLVSGRITYDHRWSIEKNKNWGNKLMLLPEIQNFTLLAIESAPFTINEVAIPYPTYFHPSNESQVAAWQEVVRSAARPWLFSFAGARRPKKARSIRDHLINQCRQSDQCMLLRCDNKNNSYKNNSCHSPTRIIKLFKHSKFYLQPSGDSFTRRSTFDSILSGCIPVFFHPGLAYTQYIWHFPKNYTKYSVFITEDEVRKGKVSIEEILSEYSEEQVRGMRENAIGMIPHIVYRDPRCEAENVRDAFDVAIEGVLDRVKRVKGGGAAAIAASVSKRFSEGTWSRFFGKN